VKIFSRTGVQLSVVTAKVDVVFMTTTFQPSIVKCLSYDPTECRPIYVASATKFIVKMNQFSFKIICLMSLLFFRFAIINEFNDYKTIRLIVFLSPT